VKHRVVLDEEYATPVLRRMAPAVRKRIRAALSALEADPFSVPEEYLSKRLELDPAKEPVYRLRVGGWRIVFTVAGLEVRVLRVIDRDEGYDWLE